jgi:PTS system ascorbate-specific IIA component
MIGILVITHEDLGDCLIRCACHVLATKPQQLAHLSVFPQEDPDVVVVKARALVDHLNSGDGVLLLCDMLGATPCNIATRLVQSGKVECLAGVNLPMLVRVLTYRNESLSVVVEKGIGGGQRAVVAVNVESCHAD